MIRDVALGWVNFSEEAMEKLARPWQCVNSNSGDRAPSPPTPSPSAWERGLQDSISLKTLPPRLGEGVGDEGAPARAGDGMDVNSVIARRR